MGSLVGHAAPGFAYISYGLWHLINNIRLFILHQDSYTSLPWFPTAKCRHLELFCLTAATFGEIALEFVVGLEARPFDPDGSIPFANLHNLEHCLINFSFFVYSILALALDFARPRTQVQNNLTFLLFAMGLSQQAQIFHHHSVDVHMGPEGQYHSLFVLLTLAALIATLMATVAPKSFVVGFVRSLCLLFVGAWIFLIGVMLWTPQLIPKGCFMVVNKEGNQVVRCSSEEALHRANSLVNLQFGILLVLVLSFGVCVYLVSLQIYAHKVDYLPLNMESDCGDAEKQHPNIDPNGKQILEMVNLFS